MKDLSKRNVSMQVDLSKARAGDTVKFRCGGQAVIDSILTTENSDDVRGLGFKGYWDSREDHLWYSLDGTAVHTNKDYPLDIISVIPAPVAFDWRDAKPGMAFSHFHGEPGEVYTFVEHDSDPDVARCLENGSGPFPYLKEFLTRAPEHDVEAVR